METIWDKYYILLNRYETLLIQQFPKENSNFKFRFINIKINFIILLQWYDLEKKENYDFVEFVFWKSWLLFLITEIKWKSVIVEQGGSLAIVEYSTKYTNGGPKNILN